MIRLNILFLSILLLISSCGSSDENTSQKEEQETKTTENESVEETEQTTAKTPTLGEDIEEFQCLVTNIYEIDGVVYIDIDLVKMEVNEDQQIITNDDAEIRTYIIDSETSMQSSECQEITPEKLLTLKKELTAKDARVALGGSQNGKITGMNFGCYG